MQAFHLGYHYLDWWASFQHWNRLNSCTIDSNCCEEWHLCWTHTFCVSVSSRSWVRSLSKSVKSQLMSKCTAELTECLSCLFVSYQTQSFLYWTISKSSHPFFWGSSFHLFSIRSTYKATAVWIAVSQTANSFSKQENILWRRCLCFPLEYEKQAFGISLIFISWALYCVGSGPALLTGRHSWCRGAQENTCGLSDISGKTGCCWSNPLLLLSGSEKNCTDPVLCVSLSVPKFVCKCMWHKISPSVRR